MNAKKSHHVSELKKSLVKDLSNLMKKKTVMIVSIKGLPSAQFQDLKKKLRNNAKIKVTKKRLIDFALDHCGIKELHDLVPYVQDSTAILFSDEDAFIISNLLSENKSPAKAKEGDIAPEDIIVKAGPTSLLPGPDISALSAVGLAPKVESGKISIMNDKVIIKKGEKINQKLASIMAKLEIIPFEIGIEPIAAYMDGKIYNNI
ncbi:MAG: 50S ribosomal protein L10, partial [Candidatus Pacearchaeota archaeon]